MNLITKIFLFLYPESIQIFYRQTKPDNIQNHFSKLQSLSPVKKNTQNHIKDLRSGLYAINGYNPSPSGTKYFGNISLHVNKHSVKAIWEIGHTKDVQSGSGFAHNGLFCISFKYKSGQKTYYGKAIYRTTRDGFEGYWVEPLSKQVGFESGKLISTQK